MLIYIVSRRQNAASASMGQKTIIRIGQASHLQNRKNLISPKIAYCCCCCVYIKTRADLYSVPSNIRTGPTDANAFRGHRLTTRKGTYYEKYKINKMTQKKVNTHAIVGRKNNQKNKAPDSQTSQATCQTKEIYRVDRFHSTREAKQNYINKKNQRSPIKTMQSHEFILVPLLGRSVFTAGFAPAMPFPTHTYKCVGGSRSRKYRVVARRQLASSSSLCQEVMNFSAPCNTRLCHGTSSSIFAARVHTALSTPNVSRLSTVEPSVAPNAWKSSLRQSSQFCSGASLAWIFPPD